MKTKNLLVKSSLGDSYLVLGYTYSVTSQPEEWQLPVIPNEYGAVNLEVVIRENLKDDYGLTLTKILNQSDDSDLVFVEVAEDEIKDPGIIFDPEEGDYLLELRGFVNKEILKSLINSQESVFGRLMLLCN